MRFACCVAYFDADIGMHCVRRVEWSVRAFKHRIISIGKEITGFSSKSTVDCVFRIAGHERLCFANCMACYDAEIDMR
jgi:hypothetical protein